MRVRGRFAWWAAVGLFLAPLLHGQTLAPRAYLITPVGTNAITITTNVYTGGVLFDNSSPLTDANGNIVMIVPTYYHALNFFGRSANITVGVPYAIGSLQVQGVNQSGSIYSSGLGDGAVRFSVNLKGGQAMKVPQFVKWKQKTVVGVSLVVQFPSGQYDPTKVINIGTNRWAFHPEVGFSRRQAKWLIDVYGGAWFYTTNPEFLSRNNVFPGTRSQTQAPIGVIEGHLSYDFKPRLWISLDGNFWYGGRTTVNGVENRSSLQKNSRIGATAAIPITGRQSIKFEYSRGAYIRNGGNYQAFAVAWQYGWIGNPFK
jgi:outer membrane putative beta-barrel porin/alpha-amylase